MKYSKIYAREWGAEPLREELASALDELCIYCEGFITEISAASVSVLSLAVKTGERADIIAPYRGSAHRYMGVSREWIIDNFNVPDVSGDGGVLVGVHRFKPLEGRSFSSWTKSLSSSDEISVYARSGFFPNGSKRFQYGVCMVSADGEVFLDVELLYEKISSLSELSAQAEVISLEPSVRLKECEWFKTGDQ